MPQKFDFQPTEEPKFDFQPESNDSFGWVDKITDSTKKFLNEHPTGKKFLNDLLEGYKTTKELNPEQLQQLKDKGINIPEKDDATKLREQVSKPFDYLANKIDNPAGEGGYVRGAIAGGLHGLGQQVPNIAALGLLKAGTSNPPESASTISPDQQIGPLRRVAPVEDFKSTSIDMVPNKEGVYAPQNQVGTSLVRTPHELPELTQTPPEQANTPIRQIPLDNDTFKDEQVSKYLSLPSRETQMSGQGRNYLDLVKDEEPILNKEELIKQAKDNHVNPKYYDTDSQDDLKVLKEDIESKPKQMPGMGRNYLDLIHPEEPEVISEQDLSQAYNKMPEMPLEAAGPKKFFIYNAGDKFNEGEINDLISSPKIKELATNISNTVHDILRTTGNSDLSNKLERIGFVFDDSIKGIHIPNPKGSTATILINPFEHLMNPDNTPRLPEQTASDILNTVFHELAHLRVNSHDDDFIEALSKIHSDFGEKNSLNTQSNILKAISDEKYPNQYNSEIQNLLSKYLASRGRQSSNTDSLIGTGISKDNPRDRTNKIPFNDRPNTERTAASAISKLKDLLTQTEPLREEQEEIYTKERGERIKNAKDVSTPGLQGFYQQLGKMKGEYSKVPPIASNMNQEDIDSLFDAITNSSNIVDEFQKLSAKEGLGKLLGVYGNGVVPQRSEISLLKKVFGEQEMQGLLDVMSEKGFLTIPRLKGKEISDIINAPKSFLATLNFHAPLRQGIGLIHKAEFWQALPTMIKSMGSEEFYQNMMNGIEESPDYAFAKTMGLRMTDARDLDNREEQFISKLPEKLPLGLGATIRMFSRGYMGFLNKLRFDTFNNLTNHLQDTQLSKEEYINASRQVATFVNNATGRGDLGRLEKMGDELNMIFFSPRMIASRYHMLSSVFKPSTYTTLNPDVRQEYLKSLLAIAGFIGGVNALGAIIGMKSRKNPISSDFGKLKEDNTRVDPGAGFLQDVTFAARFLMNEEETSTGKNVQFGSNFNAPTRLSLTSNFAQSKLSPAAQFAVDLAKGTDFEGKPVNLAPQNISREVMDKFTPMVLGDLYNLYKNDPKLFPLGAASILGMPTRTYQPQEKSPFGKLRLN